MFPTLKIRGVVLTCPPSHEGWRGGVPYFPTYAIRISRLAKTGPSVPPERQKLQPPPPPPCVRPWCARQVIRRLVLAAVKKDLFYPEDPHDAMHT